METIKKKNILIAVVTGQNFLNILYWFEESRNTTDNEGRRKNIVTYEDKEKKEECFLLSVLSFACAKERTKEKHPGNDIQPLPDALIKL